MPDRRELFRRQHWTAYHLESLYASCTLALQGKAPTPAYPLTPDVAWQQFLAAWHRLEDVR